MLLNQLRYICVYCCLKFNSVPYGCGFLLGSSFMGVMLGGYSQKFAKFYKHDDVHAIRLKSSWV